MGRAYGPSDLRGRRLLGMVWGEDGKGGVVPCEDVIEAPGADFCFSGGA